MKLPWQHPHPSGSVNEKSRPSVRAQRAETTQRNGKETPSPSNRTAPKLSSWQWAGKTCLWHQADSASPFPRHSATIRLTTHRLTTTCALTFSRVFRSPPWEQKERHLVTLGYSTLELQAWPPAFQQGCRTWFWESYRATAMCWTSAVI
jgi:hypothetical protein